MLRARAYDALDQRSRALGAYREATRLQPDNPAAWRALALFLEPDRAAIPAWTQVRRLDPRDPDASVRGDAP
jgi:cytochrome c-type biogenesis protein CcmH/NrfG